MKKIFFETQYLYILHQNIAGLIRKADALTVGLEDLINRGIDVDILCITEHFMMAGYENYLSLPNYSLAACFSRPNSKRGGSCIMVKNGHQWKELKEIANLSLINIFECCAIELVANKLLIVCVCRVPNGNLDVFFNKLEKLLNIISKTKKYEHLLIAGDFNIDLLKSNSITLNFECLLLNFNLKFSIKQPTRLVSRTCIDNIIHDYKKHCKTEVIEFAVSDHTAQLLKFPVNHKPKLNFWRKKKRDYSLENVNKFKNCLKNLSFSEMYNSPDPNIAYNKFVENFKLFYDLCFPFVTVTIRVKSKPKWLSRGVRLCSKKKRQLLWKFRRKPSRHNKIKFYEYSKLLKRIINLAKRAQNNYKLKTSSNLL